MQKRGVQSLPPPTLKAYLGRLVRKWFFLAVFIFDILGFILLPIFHIVVPTWIYIVIFVLCFLGANYGVYRDLLTEWQAHTEEYDQVLAAQRETIQEIENRRPKLRVGFAVGDDLVSEARLHVQPIPPEQNLDALVTLEEAELRRAFAEYGAALPGPAGSQFNDVLRSISATADLIMKPRKSAELYEDECASYLRRYRGYLMYSRTHALFKARFRQPRLVLENVGTTPATHIVVVLKFPSALRFPDDDELRWLEMDEVAPDERPERPEVFQDIQTSLLGGAMPWGGLANLISPDVPVLDFSQPSARGPFISNKGGHTEVTLEIDRLEHGFRGDGFDSVGFFVPVNLPDQRITLPYKIYASELPLPIEGHLVLVISEVKES